MNDDSARPRVSVVIAAFNAASTIGEQLAALVAQGPRSWEVLVCDNGSTDSTRDVVRDWAARHPEIVLVDASARRGPAAARNIGVAASHGELVAFCDADDVVGQGWADALEEALREHDFIAGRFDLDRLRRGSAFSVSWSPQLEGLTRLAYLPDFVTAGAGNMAMRRSVFDDISGFDERSFTTEDDDLCLRAQLAGHELAFVPTMVLHVRKRTGLLSTYRQAVDYGRGARRLEHRYALVAAAHAGSSTHEHPQATTQASPAGTGDGTPRRVVRRLLSIGPRLLAPSTLANAVWRIGWRYGWRTARPADVDQLPATIAPGQD